MTARNLITLIFKLFTAAALTAQAHCGNALPDDAAASAFTYEAEFETGNGLYAKMHRVLFDKGRYRMEYNPGWQPTGVLPLDAARDITEIYDGTPEHGVWFTSGGSATTSASTTNRAYYQEAQRDGTEAVMRRYHLTGHSVFNPHLTHSAYSRIPNLAKLDAYGDVQIHKTGTDTIAGYVCDRCEGEITFPRAGQENKHPALQKEGVQVWIEPKTRLVLKLDKFIAFAGGRIPPKRETFQVRKLKFLPSVPLSRFQLSPGTSVGLLEVDKNIYLPPGVTRQVFDTSGARPRRIF